MTIQPVSIDPLRTLLSLKAVMFLSGILSFLNAFCFRLYNRLSLGLGFPIIDSESTYTLNHRDDMFGRLL